MSNNTELVTGHQETVNEYFRFQSSFWKDIYTLGDVYAEIHQQRLARVVDWVEQLGLPKSSQILEIGCGAGFLSLALNEHGFRVHAIDSVDAMVEQTRQRAEEAGVADQISTGLGDITSLEFADESFDLVLAIGVIPWIGEGDEPAKRAIKEMARVARSGSYIIFTADNRNRFASWFDPWLTPPLDGFKRGVRNGLDRTGIRRRPMEKINSYLHSPRFIDRTLVSSGLVKVKSVTLGFGPFTFFRRPLLSNKAGIALHHRLQRLAERGVPVFRKTGAQYIVQAQKPGVVSPDQSLAAQKTVSGSL
jgi:ubiquinone/menaquinone biosynthesis C-methylase UbiE